MVREVEKEGRSVTRTAEAFGFSRPAFYQIKAAFDDKGLSGLIPQKRGPRGRHKLSAEIMDYAVSQRGENPDIGVPELLNMIKRNFGLTVHRRSLERALKQEKKNGRRKGDGETEGFPKGRNGGGLRVAPLQAIFGGVFGRGGQRPCEAWARRMDESDKLSARLIADARSENGDDGKRSGDTGSV